MINKSGKNQLSIPELLPILFFVGRILLFLALIPDDLHGFGDFPIYFDIAALPGLPFFNYWVEYPPIYAWTIELISFLSAGNQFIFDFILYLLLTIAGSVSIWLMGKILEFLDLENQELLNRLILFFGILSFTSYTWWYFDLIPVAMVLGSIYFFLKEKDTSTGLLVGIGILTKWFPILLLPAFFKYRKTRSFFKITLIAIGISVIVWGIFLIISPDMTIASLISQPSRTSWETIWALIDGNMTTGAYIPLEWRTLPENADYSSGNPARIPTLLSLIILGGLGLTILVKHKDKSNKSLLRLIAITFLLFFIWSPGWSPQWILFLLPLLIFVFPLKKSLLFSLIILLLAFIEWPMLLGHYIFAGLWIIVPLRTILFIGILLQCIKINNDSGT